MTDAPAQPLAAKLPASELVPEFWPPADPIEPVKAWRIHWLLAPLATIPAVLLPRRMGPHLGHSSWAAAYTVHILSGFVAVGGAFAAALENSSSGSQNLASLFLFNPFLELRHALAGSVLFLYGLWNGWLDVLGTLLTLALIEGAIWAVGLLLIPLYAAGEGARRAYMRSVKLVLWSSACQVPISWAFARLVIVLEPGTDEVILVAWFAALELWWLWVLVRLGGRYGGPVEGPRWRERQPGCEFCGYSLVSLPFQGRCPECGTAVAESLPERRRPPAFATARGLRGRCAGFLRTTWDALFARRFARSVTIWGHHRSARVYAILVCTLIGAICGATGLLARWVDLGGPSVARWFDGRALARHLDTLFHILAAATLSGITGGLVAALLTLKVGLFLSRFGFRDVADRVVILCYSTAWLLVPVLLATIGAWTAYGVIETWGPFKSFRVIEDTWIDRDLIVWFVCLAPAVVALVMGLFRVRVMLRHTRFANA